MHWAARIADRLFAPGPFAFATLFAVESLARALLTVVVPVVALAVLGDARDVSLAFSLAVCFVIVASQAIPPLLRRFGPHVVYAAAAVLMAAVPLCLSLSSGAATVAAIALRALSAACAMNALHLLIMTHIGRRDLARMEPLRVFASAGAWCAAPVVGVRLYEFVSPWAAYGVAIAAASLLLCHVIAVRIRSCAAEAASPAPSRAAPRFAPVRNLRRFVVQPRLRLAYVLNLVRESWWLLFLVYVPIYMVTVGMGAAAGGYLVAAGTAMLFTTPLFGRLARRIGMRPVIVGGFAVCGLGTLLAAAMTPWPYAFAACILASAVGAMALDSVTMVTFQRAVRAHERPEMTVVFATYRDAAALVSTGIFGALLSFFGLWCVFAAAGLWLFACAWLARHVPRGM
jgi:MFS family permease